MTKNRLFILLIFTMLLSLSSWSQEAADSGYSCDDRLSKFEDLLNISTYSDCAMEDRKVKCDCIQAAIANDKSDEDSVGSLNLKNQIAEAYNMTQRMVDQKKAPYYEQYSQVYKMMTVNAAAQKLVFSIDERNEDGKKVIGCTPKDMTAGVKRKTTETIGKQVEAIKKLQNEAMNEYAACPKVGKSEYGECNYFKNRAELLGQKLARLAQFEDPKSDESCYRAIQILQNKDSEKSRKSAINSDLKSMWLKKIKDFKEAKEINIISNYGYLTGPKSDNNSVKQKKDVDLLHELYPSKNLGLTQPRSTPFKQYDFLDNVAGRKFNKDAETFNANIEQVENDRDYIFANLGKEGFEDVKKLLKDKKINCHQFISDYAYRNEKMNEDADLQGAVKLPTIDCPEGDSICLAFAIKNQELLINTAKLYAPEKEGENSCLTYAEFVTYKGMPSPDLLNDIATSTHPEKLLDPNYTGLFSKGKDEEKRKFLQANPLIVQLAQKSDQDAIEVGKRLQEMARSINKHDSEASKFNKYLNFMNGKDGLAALYRKSGAESSMATCDDLQSSFTAISLSNEPTVYKPRRDQKVVYSCIGNLYKGNSTSDLNKSLENNKIYQLANKADDIPNEDSYNLFVAQECPAIMSDKQKQKLADIKQPIQQQGIQRSFNREEFSKVSSSLNEAEQDHEFKNKYHEEVTSKMDHNVLASANDRGEFSAAMKSNQSIRSVQSGGFEKDADSPNQVRPVFSSPAVAEAPVMRDFKSVAPQAMRQATSMTDIDPTFNQRPVEDQLSSYKALEEYVADKGPAPAFSPSEEIKKLEKSISESKDMLSNLEKEEVSSEESEKEIAKISGSPSSRAPASFSQAGFVAPIPNAPVLGQFPGSKSFLRSEAKISKAEKSYQAALIRKYEIDPSLQILIQGQDAAVDSPYVIKTDNVLVADDVYPFSLLNDPGKLCEFLSIKVGGKIVDGESVKIVDPESHNYFLLKATVKNGVISYQRYPFVKEKDIRIARLGDLNNTINVSK